MLSGTAWDTAHAAEGAEALRAAFLNDAQEFLARTLTAEPADKVRQGDMLVTNHRHERAVITTTEDAHGLVHTSKLD